MKKTIGMALTIIVILTLSVLGIVLGNNNLTELQLRTLKILAIVCGSSIAYCFIVGEIAEEYSKHPSHEQLGPDDEKCLFIRCHQSAETEFQVRHSLA